VALWADRDDVPAPWPDGARLPAAHVDMCLDAAQDACEAYAPALELDAEIPARYTLAVVYQAREIHNASRRTGDSEMVGDAAYPIRVPPLSGAVKALLRPRRAVPGVG
jgi:hypothetical protein